MNFIYFVKLYFLTFIVFLGIDFVWLSKIAPNFYRQNIGHLLADKPNLIAAGIFYLVNIVGIIVFAILPGIEKGSLKHTLIYGALYGFFTYATYDLTNLATLRGWPLKVSVVDIIWGTVLSGLVAAAGYYIGTKIV